MTTHCSKLPDDKLRQLLAMIEMLPIEERPQKLLETFRPRMSTLRPPRRMTLQRLLLLPVEDMLDSPELYRRDIGRLCRRSIPTCWNAIKQQFDRNVFNDLMREAREIEWVGEQAQIELGSRLWPTAAEALHKALALADSDRNAAKQMFGDDPDVQRQIATFAGIFEIGTEVMTARASLPVKPIDKLQVYHIETIKAALCKLRLGSPDLTRNFLQVLAARMINPGQLLDLLSAGSFPGSDQERGRLIGDLATRITENLLRQTANLRSFRGQSADPIIATTMARRLLEGYNSLRPTFVSMGMQEICGEASLKSAMASVHEARIEIRSFILDTIVVQADQSLFKLINHEQDSHEQDSHATLAGNIDRQEAAESMALALHYCAVMAKELGIGREVDFQVSVICQELENRAPPVISTIRLIELLAGPDAAERLFNKSIGR
ncbi:MAG: hypothetical protein WCK65_06910 [Rhodospirillaceae bacterium]